MQRAIAHHGGPLRPRCHSERRNESPHPRWIWTEWPPPYNGTLVAEKGGNTRFQIEQGQETVGAGVEMEVMVRDDRQVGNGRHLNPYACLPPFRPRRRPARWLVSHTLLYPSLCSRPRGSMNSDAPPQPLSASSVSTFSKTHSVHSSRAAASSTVKTYINTAPRSSAPLPTFPLNRVAN